MKDWGVSNYMPVGLNYSGGSGSRWPLEAMLRGEIPRPRFFAVFTADTMDEHAWTYRDMLDVEARCKAAGIPFFRASHPSGGLSEHILRAVREGGTRMDNPPYYIAKGDGAGRAVQKCTKEFKIAVLRRMQRAWLASLRLPKSFRVGLKQMTTWIGFGADEGGRAQKAVAALDVQWSGVDFPAIRVGITRAEQRQQLTKWNGHAPLFSACVHCPYKTPDRWAVTPPEEQAKAIEVDETIRDLDQFGLTEGSAYISNQLIPLRDVLKKIKPMSQEEWAKNATEEPRGCDSGACFV